jgi:hypothetical protein
MMNVRFIQYGNNVKQVIKTERVKAAGKKRTTVSLEPTKKKRQNQNVDSFAMGRCGQQI